jgi:hypothetical protein
MERWEDIQGYEGIYQVSSQGNVKSLARTKILRGRIYPVNERILKPGLNSSGYLGVVLCKNNKQRTLEIHKLVWDHFGSEPRNGRQVDHDDNIKTHNWIENLKLKTNRQNCTKGFLQHPKTSQYTGVHWDRNRQKWISQIYLNGKLQHLGRFNDEFIAHQAYQTALSNHIASGGA